MGAFQNHLHALYGLPGGFNQSTISNAAIGGGWKRKKYDREELAYIEREIKKSNARKQMDRQLMLDLEEEEEFLMTLMLDD